MSKTFSATSPCSGSWYLSLSPSSQRLLCRLIHLIAAESALQISRSKSTTPGFKALLISATHSCSEYAFGLSLWYRWSCPSTLFLRAKWSRRQERLRITLFNHLHERARKNYTTWWLSHRLLYLWWHRTLVFLRYRVIKFWLHSACFRALKESQMSHPIRGCDIAPHWSLDGTLHTSPIEDGTVDQIMEGDQWNKSILDYAIYTEGRWMIYTQDREMFTSPWAHWERPCEATYMHTKHSNMAIFYGYSFNGFLCPMARSNAQNSPDHSMAWLDSSQVLWETVHLHILLQYLSCCRRP